MELNISIEAIILVLLLIICIVALLIHEATKKIEQNYDTKLVYDERQKSVLGDSYKTSFLVLVILLAIDVCLDEFGFYEKTVLTSSIGIFAILMVGLLVYAIKSIMNDAYYGVERNHNIRNYKFYLIVLVALNLVNGFSQALSGIYEDGKLRLSVFAAFAVAISLAIILVASAVRDYQRKKEEAVLDEEDTDEES